MLVVLNIVDDAAYQSYREMDPILKRYGGGFGYNLKVSEVLTIGSHPLERAVPSPLCLYQ